MPDTGDVVVQTMPTDEEIVSVLREPQGFSHAVEVFTQLRVGREQELPSAIGLNIEAQTQMRERASHWLESLRPMVAWKLSSTACVHAICCSNPALCP